MSNKSATTPLKIEYFYDALCGWCFGFSPVINRLREEFQDQIDFEIISGGLSLGPRVGPIGVVAPYIKAGAYKTVEERCGVAFGEAFINGPLEEGNMIMNSLPPAVALAIVKAQKAEMAFTFASLLHQAVYVDGLHPEDIDGYGIYAEQIGLDPKLFVSDMANPEFHSLAQAEFAHSKGIGVSGFPSLVGHIGESRILLSNGYLDYPNLRARTEAFLAEYA
ncbi:MAG: DsbA family protein [Bacteroidota bacterium]